MKFKERLSHIFGADLRSLAVLRVGLGLLLIADLINRGRDLVGHYSDFGLLPRQAWLEIYQNPWRFSIHAGNGSWQWQALLFLIAGLAACSLIIGYKTRLATVISWILLVSLQNRNPMVLQGGDVLFRMLLFFSMFMPMGAIYALDSIAFREKNRLPERTVSAATIGYLFQIVCLYWFSVLLKTGPEWRTDFTAVYFALNIDQFTTPVGHFLLGLKNLLKPLTFLTVATQTVSPVLFFAPFLGGPLRTIGILALMTMHLGLAVSMRLGLFPWIAIVGLLGLLPSWFFNQLGPIVKTKRRRNLLIYYDGECLFCGKMVLIIKNFLLIPETRLLAAQSKDETHRLLHQYNSWIIKTETGYHLGFRGFIEIARASPLLWPIGWFFGLPVIKQVGDRLYRAVSDRRSLGIPVELPTAKRPANLKPNILTNFLVLALLGIVIGWNLSTLPKKRVEFPNYLKPVVEVLRLDQEWNIFAPSPIKDDGWYVIPARFANGKKFDISSGKKQPVSFEKPGLVSDSYKNQRARKYMMNLYLSENDRHRLEFGRFLCRSFNKAATEGERLEEFEIIFMLERTGDDGMVEKPKEVLLWNHFCFDQKAEKID